ncbi:hypothetical protein TNCV_3779171 [Trichonephila clavipes]|nr:hypothetical protein TNCV_3779171 [Trichonephila clavipes]
MTMHEKKKKRKGGEKEEENERAWKPRIIDAADTEVDTPLSKLCISKIQFILCTEVLAKNKPNIVIEDIFLKHDEAHFWLNGYLNKQNCRIWSEANPQVYVETPLHPEKLTVWCALWAGGILLQKR